MRYLPLLVFLFGCVNPNVIVNKNVPITITVNGNECTDDMCQRSFPVWINVEVEYTTKSDLDTDFKADQDIKPPATVPVPF